MLIDEGLFERYFLAFTSFVKNDYDSCITTHFFHILCEQLTQSSPYPCNRNECHKF